jgi:Tfp pilus assembly protein PilN
MKKLAINLLQDELTPEQPVFTLKRVVFAWGGAFILMLCWVFISQYQLDTVSDEMSVLNQQKKQNDALLTRLKKQVEENKADPLIQERLATIKLLLANKKRLHQQLTDSTSTYAVGFSAAMTELSQLHHRDVSLQTVQIKPQIMRFSGLARKPEAVPAWLAAFENSTFLAGQTFNHLSLNENAQKLTEFTVSSRKLTQKEGG